MMCGWAWVLASTGKWKEEGQLSPFVPYGPEREPEKAATLTRPRPKSHIELQRPIPCQLRSLLLRHKRPFDEVRLRKIGHREPSLSVRCELVRIDLGRCASDPGLELGVGPLGRLRALGRGEFGSGDFERVDVGEGVVAVGGVCEKVQGARRQSVGAIGNWLCGREDVPARWGEAWAKMMV